MLSRIILLVSFCFVSLIHQSCVKPPYDEEVKKDKKSETTKPGAKSSTGSPPP
jgi:hypothetical protein